MGVPDDQGQGVVRTGMRTKFIIAFAVQTIVIAVCIVLVQQWLVRRAMERQSVDQGRAIANTIDATAAYYVLFGLTDDLKNITTDLKRNASIAYADFVGADGAMLAATGTAVPPAVAKAPLRRTDGTAAGGGWHLFIVPF